jgi:hypothetical protein
MLSKGLELDFKLEDNHPLDICGFPSGAPKNETDAHNSARAEVFGTSSSLYHSKRFSLGRILTNTKPSTSTTTTSTRTIATTIAATTTTTTAAQNNFDFYHSASTLPGSSGSPVVSLETGKVVVVHKSGTQLKRNSATKASALEDLLEAAVKLATKQSE